MNQPICVAFQRESVALLDAHVRLRGGGADGPGGGRVLAVLQGVPAVPLHDDGKAQVQVFNNECNILVVQH